MAKYRVKREPVVQPQDQSIKLIPLTQGQVAIVDAADYEWLMQWNWAALWNPCTQSFYANRRNWPESKGGHVLMHRQIIGLERGDPREGDHRDGNTLNNRRNNLRHCTKTQNRQNHSGHSNSTTGVAGVVWHKRDLKYQVYVNANGKRYHRGYYDSFQEAVAARMAAVIELHGEFARIPHIKTAQH